MNTMENKSDVVIIGAGAIGLCSAYYLSRAGLRVTVLEKGQAGHGCSWGNAGLIVPSHFVPLAAPGMVARGLRWMFKPTSPFYIRPRFSLELFSWLWRFYRSCTDDHVRNSMPLLRDLHLASLAEFEELAEILDNDFGLQKQGLLLLYRSSAGERECQEMLEAAEAIGIQATHLSAEAISDLDPNLLTRLSGVYFPDDAHLDPARFVTGLRDFLIQQGVNIRSHTEVRGFQSRDGKVAAVETEQGSVAAEQFVLAAGSWSPTLTRDLGIKLPIQPAKGYSITVNHSGPLPRIPLVCTEAKVAVTPLANRIRFAGTLELSGLDGSMNLRRVKAVLAAVPEYLPEFKLGEIDPGEAWSGMRPCTPDGLPILGRFPGCHNLIAATGHAMIGMSLAPITGKLVSEIATNQEPGIDVSALRVDRW